MNALDKREVRPQELFVFDSGFELFKQFGRNFDNAVFSGVLTSFLQDFLNGIAANNVVALRTRIYFAAIKYF